MGHISYMYVLVVIKHANVDEIANHSVQILNRKYPIIMGTTYSTLLCSLSSLSVQILYH